MFKTINKKQFKRFLYHIFLYSIRSYWLFKKVRCHGRRDGPSEIIRNEIDVTTKEMHQVPLIDGGNIIHLHKA
jgi:hypothetical protein